jgi:hypothetical protein
MGILEIIGVILLLFVVYNDIVAANYSDLILLTGSITLMTLVLRNFGLGIIVGIPIATLFGNLVV